MLLVSSLLTLIPQIFVIGFGTIDPSVFYHCHWGNGTSESTRILYFVLQCPKCGALAFSLLSAEHADAFSRVAGDLRRHNVHVMSPNVSYVSSHGVRVKYCSPCLNFPCARVPAMKSKQKMNQDPKSTKTDIDNIYRRKIYYHLSDQNVCCAANPLQMSMHKYPCICILFFLCPLNILESIVKFVEIHTRNMCAEMYPNG